MPIPFSFFSSKYGYYIPTSGGGSPTHYIPRNGPSGIPEPVEDRFIIPTMTSYTAPYGLVTASSEIQPASNQAWKAFDNDDSSAWYSSPVGSGANLTWIQYQFPQTYTVFGFYIKFVGAPPGGQATYYNCNLLGSNDGSSWTTITTASGINDANKHLFTISNSGQFVFSYYRVSFLNPTNAGAFEPLLNTIQLAGY